MPNFTQMAITDAFTELLNERPIDKITINDITSRCEINRNTFYYHYHDIYDLLDSILTEQSNKLLQVAHSDFSTWKNAVLAGTSFALENKQAIYNIYNSVNRDRLESYLYDTLHISLEQFVEIQAEGLDVDQTTLDHLTMFLSSAIEGLLINWLREGMKEDPEVFIEDMGRLFDRSTRDALEKACGR